VAGRRGGQVRRHLATVQLAQPQPGPGARRVRRSLPGLRGTPGQVLVPLTDLLTRPGGTGEMQPDAADGHLTDTGRAS